MYDDRKDEAIHRACMKYAKDEIPDLEKARAAVSEIMHRYYSKAKTRPESTDGDALHFSTTSLSTSVHQLGHDIKNSMLSFTSLENRQRFAKDFSRSMQSAARNLHGEGLAGAVRNGPLPAFQVVP